MDEERYVKGFLKTLANNKDLYKAFVIIVENEKKLWWKRTNTVQCSEMPYYVGGCKSLDDILNRIKRDIEEESKGAK